MNLPHPFQNVANVVKSCIPSPSDIPHLEAHRFQDLFETELGTFLSTPDNNITEGGFKYLRTLNQTSTIGSIVDSYYEVVDEDKDPNFDQSKVRTFLITRLKVPLKCTACERTTKTHLINKSELRFKSLHVYDRIELFAENNTPCPVCQEAAIDQYLKTVMLPLQQFEKDHSFLPLQDHIQLSLSDFRKTQLLLERHSRKNRLDGQLHLELNAYNSNALPLDGSPREFIDELLFLYERQLVRIAGARYGRQGSVFLYFELRRSISLDVNSIGDSDDIFEMLLDHSWRLCLEFIERMLPHRNIEYSLEYIDTIRELLANICPSHLNFIFYLAEKDFLYDKTRYESFKLVNILKANLRRKLEYFVANQNKYPPERYINYFEIDDHHLAFLKLILPSKSIVSYKLLTPKNIMDQLFDDVLQEDLNPQDTNSILEPSDLGRSSHVDT